MFVRRIPAMLIASILLSALTGCPSVDVEFSATPTSGVAPLQVQFRDISPFSVLPTRVWDFSDDEVSHDAAPVHTFTKPGLYTVTLRTYSAIGFGHETKQDFIQVTPNERFVPNVVGMTQAIAQDAITAASLTVGAVEEAFSETVPAGQISSQDPAAGVSVALGTAINLTLSKGPDRRTVPNVVGMTQSAAQSAIANVGLAVGVVTQVFSESVPMGQVISQDPAAGVSVVPGTPVNLTASKGPQGGEVTPVPNVVGMTQAAAESSLTSAGLSVGIVVQAFSESVAIGQVIGQDPVAGSSVAPATAVNLSVSKGPDHRTVPNVVGMAQSAAQSAVTNVGLAVGVVTQVSSETIPADQVLAQDPAAGSNVAPGTPVNLTVAKDPAAGTVRAFVSMPFAWIPAGSFDMGSAKTAAELSQIYGDRVDYFSSEQPQHRVTITKGFWMGVHEVTQAEWMTVMNFNPSDVVGDDHPVEKVSWDECKIFIDGLNDKAQGIFRLPTEAEREYACRAGTTTEFYFGDDTGKFHEYEWGFDIADYSTHAVAQKKPNPWGLYDMHGNVMELCADWYNETYYTVSPESDPTGPNDGTFRVRRGGSFRSSIGGCRSAYRTWNKPAYHISNTGLRLCRDK